MRKRPDPFKHPESILNNSKNENLNEENKNNQNLHMKNKGINNNIYHNNIYSLLKEKSSIIKEESNIIRNDSKNENLNQNKEGNLDFRDLVKNINNPYMSINKNINKNEEVNNISQLHNIRNDNNFINNPYSNDDNSDEINQKLLESRIYSNVHNSDEINQKLLESRIYSNDDNSDEINQKLLESRIYSNDDNSDEINQNLLKSKIYSNDDNSDEINQNLLKSKIKAEGMTNSFIKQQDKPSIEFLIDRLKDAHIDEKTQMQNARSKEEVYTIDYYTSELIKPIIEDLHSKGNVEINQFIHGYEQSRKDNYLEVLKKIYIEEKKVFKEQEKMLEYYHIESLKKSLNEIHNTEKAELEKASTINDFGKIALSYNSQIYKIRGELSFNKYHDNNSFIQEYEEARNKYHGNFLDKLCQKEGISYSREKISYVNKQQNSIIELQMPPLEE